jgi:hypothetical protein
MKLCYCVFFVLVSTRTNIFYVLPFIPIILFSTSLLDLCQLSSAFFSAVVFFPLLPPIFSIHKMWTWIQRSTAWSDPLTTIALVWLDHVIWWVTMGNMSNSSYTCKIYPPPHHRLWYWWETSLSLEHFKSIYSYWMY